MYIQSVCNHNAQSFTGCRLPQAGFAVVSVTNESSLPLYAFPRVTKPAVQRIGTQVLTQACKKAYKQHLSVKDALTGASNTRQHICPS